MYPDALLESATKLVERLADNHLTITVAESCTGGLLGGLITSVSGSSNVFNQGYITYSNEAKHQLLGVDEALLQKHGAVSEQVASAMAVGAQKAANADLAISITGIAGPGGGTKEKPVGLVYIGCAFKDDVDVTQNIFQGDRQDIRMQSCTSAIERALACLN